MSTRTDNDVRKHIARPKRTLLTALQALLALLGIMAGVTLSGALIVAAYTTTLPAIGNFTAPYTSTWSPLWDSVLDHGLTAALFLATIALVPLLAPRRLRRQIAKVLLVVMYVVSLNLGLEGPTAALAGLAKLACWPLTRGQPPIFQFVINVTGTTILVAVGGILLGLATIGFFKGLRFKPKENESKAARVTIFDEAKQQANVRTTWGKWLLETGGVWGFALASLLGGASLVAAVFRDLPGVTSRIVRSACLVAPIVSIYWWLTFTGYWMEGAAMFLVPSLIAAYAVLFRTIRERRQRR